MDEIKITTLIKQIALFMISITIIALVVSTIYSKVLIIYYRNLILDNPSAVIVSKYTSTSYSRYSRSTNYNVVVDLDGDLNTKQDRTAITNYNLFIQSEEGDNLNDHLSLFE